MGEHGKQKNENLRVNSRVLSDELEEQSGENVL